MGYDQALLERVRALPALQGLEERRMFGSWAFFKERHMVCAVRDDSFVVRVGAEAYEATLEEPHVDTFPPRSENQGRVMTGFVTVDPQGIAGDDELAGWVGRGLAFVATLPPK